MSKIDYQALREAAERAIPEMELLTLPFDAWLSKQELKDYGVDIDVINTFRLLAGPETMLELLDEIKRLEDTNIDAMCQIAELEASRAALVAENAGLKAICDDRRRFIMNGVQMGYIKVPAAETDQDLETIRIAISPQKPIPATDAFLSEVRAQGVDAAIEAAKNLVVQEYEYKDFKAAQSDCCMHPGSDLVGKVEMTEWLVDFAAQLRKGGNQ
ncbi:ead/Ea22-like family protein [Escherichia coli]|nr:ead/Ea22-like family protein [Salmonella enterica subsp. enterica serovar Heidelberg]MCV7924939.1 ead/Ea22-like family protein [Escherichia coli]MDN1910836.1 ead/Ea22-like family protein [Escherichia coli]